MSCLYAVDPGGARTRARTRTRRGRSQPLAGLCAACANAADCTFQRDRARVVAQCEEFAGDGPRASVDLDVRPARTDAGGRVPGLCANCEERDSCRFPRPQGGVWRCEEYR